MSRKTRPLVLSEADCLQLAHAAERHDNWRTRQRCRTLLMLYSGNPINTVAAEQGIERDTVAWPPIAMPGSIMALKALSMPHAVEPPTSSLPNTSPLCVNGLGPKH